MLDWFDKAKEFKKSASEQLSQTDFAVLEESETPENSMLPEKVEVRAVEIPGVYRVQGSYEGYSGLRFFMDGVQKTVLWQYYNYEGAQVPIFIHFSGASIMERVREDKYVPFDAVYRSEIMVPSFLKETGGFEEVVDTGAEKYWDLNEIRSRAKVKSKALRQELELEMVSRFVDSEAADEALLVKDGNLIGTSKSKHVVGLIKTHSTLYLQKNYPQVQRMVWNMDEYHRSNVFSIIQREGEGAWCHRSNSFYLRIHPLTQPETGLLRVEYEGLPMPVDELASWLIAERYIRAECSRWDRQIYPIQVCEDYLRTQLPNTRAIETVLKSL